MGSVSLRREISFFWSLGFSFGFSQLLQAALVTMANKTTEYSVVLQFKGRMCHDLVCRLKHFKALIVTIHTNVQP
jgi:hypothetical protein